MMAVEMLRTYKKERNNERKESGSNVPRNEEVENVEKIIIQCQQDMQNEILEGTKDP
jgi:hypothetical protein